MSEEVKVTFIIPKDCRSENECSEDMQLAFVAAEQHSGGGIQSKWAHESLIKSFDGITKRDVFVLSEFKGELFEKLRNTKCLVVGPRCLACCLTEGSPIPSGPEPVFTVAMRDLMVSASGLTKEKKEYIKRKVHWMGGIYNTVLTVNSTHLISDTVLSEKYVKAVEKGIPVMSETWVEAVWQASLHLNINGSSTDFDLHRLPAFANLQVTTSGISKKDKQIIVKLVNENGGTFSGAFQSETTDVVILTKDGIGSEKYKAALEYGKICVLPSWVKDSAAKGVALPVSQYKITGASTSSPLSEHRVPDMSLNFSRITNSRPPSNFVDETRSTDVSTMSTKAKLSQEMKKSNDSMDKDVQMAFENFDMSLIKKAGPIFDGFCIWVCGVEGVARERCAACVSRCGGVRYDAFAPRVTHALAGSPAAAAAACRAAPAVPVLSPLWLLRSVEAGRPLDEAEFVIDVKPKTPVKSSTRKLQSEVASPMSKRNLQLLRRGPLDLPPPTPHTPQATPHIDIEPNNELVNHYLSQNAEQNQRTPMKEIPQELPPAQEMTSRQEQPDMTEDRGDEPTEEMEQIFRGVKIEVQGLDEEAIIEIGAEVAACGGALAAAGAGGSHVLVPLDFDPQDLITKHAEPVTVFWVKDCLSEQELVEIQYYHRPVRVPQSCAAPLHGVVASLSTYSGVERAFLDELAKLLGATTQLRFCRRNTTNAIASTHLICPSASGDKYMGAVKWNLPAVRASWLLECAKQGRRVSEKEHLVGDTKAPPSVEDVEEEAEPVGRSDEQTDNATDKENAMLPPLDVNVPRRGSVPSVEHTPRPKHLNEGEEMSPASRYIAMARQGLLGGDSQNTPKQVQQLKHDDKLGGEGFRTPPLEDALSSPNLAGFSPRTRRRLQAIRRGDPPSGPIRTPLDPFERNVSTPDSEFGCALAPGSGRLSPDSRKRLWRLVDQLPSKQPEPLRDNHTPLSEIRNRFLAQYGGESSTSCAEHVFAPRKLQLPDSPDTPPAKIAKLSNHRAGVSMNVTHEERKENSVSSAVSAASEAGSLVDVQLQRLDEALASRLSSQRQRRPTRDSISAPPPPPVQDSEFGPESQPNTVGWDDTKPAPPPNPPTNHVKRFMLSSNVDNREELIEMIVRLGGEVSEGAELDAAATHLLCAAPSRSEKMLGSIAAGRWVLHPAYIPRSRQANKFLPEEEFEWGNPAATCLPGVAGPERVLARAAHVWRGARGAGAAGAFAGLVALLHVPPPRRTLLARLLAAGGGRPLDDEPPYSNEEVNVCFADIKRYPLSARDAQWLVSRRIPVCAPVLLSSYLTDDEPPRPEQHCLPEYRPPTS